MEFLQVEEEIASKFQGNIEEAWADYCALPSWEQREQVKATLQTQYPKELEIFLDKYKTHMQPFIRDDFYDALENNMPFFTQKYAHEGSIDIPLLKKDCLDAIAQWSLSSEIESKAKVRYETTRSVYPPGEVIQWDDSDPRKSLKSQMNMSAIGSTKMNHNDAVQWIYHSPHLQMFVQQTMELGEIYPYHNDLGVSVNVMKPLKLDAQNALAFHFDTIDSSIKDSIESGNNNSRGATGVIGIQDCTVGGGGERITFPNVNRKRVNAVKTVIDQFDPLNPSKSFIDSIDSGGDGQIIEPLVVNEPISGVLSLFNGGDILHGVSSVRDGIRIASVFLYCEARPVETQSLSDSANAFYN